MVFKFKGENLSFEDQPWEVYFEDKVVESVSLRTALIKLNTWYVFGYQNGWFLKVKLFQKEIKHWLKTRTDEENEWIFI